MVANYEYAVRTNYFHVTDENKKSRLGKPDIHTKNGGDKDAKQ